MRIELDRTFLLIGDSITDAGRDPSGEPTPWNTEAGLGRGYVSLFHALLENVYPGRRVRVINKGVGGNTVRDLEARWEEDVMRVMPHWLAICIGINDVWRQFDCPRRHEEHVLIEEYENTYRKLLTRTQEKLSLDGLVLISPFMVEPNKNDPMRRQMDEYGKVVRQLAEEHKALLVDAQGAIDRLLEHHHPMEIAWDRIHLNTVGHMSLAMELLAVVEGSE